MLKLPTLRYRQQRADMICVYSLNNNIYDLDYSLFFTLAGDAPTRGHSFKFFKPQLLLLLRLLSHSCFEWHKPLYSLQIATYLNV